MISDYLNSIHTAKKVVFLICCLCIISVIGIDKLYLGNSIFREGWPILSMDHLIRSTIIFLSTIGIFYSLIGLEKPIFSISEGKGLSFELVSILIVVFTSVVVLLLFLFQPTTFNELSKEDNIIEWGSAILLFGSFFFTAFSLFNYTRSLNNLKLVKLFLGLMSFAFFIIFMEEVSWFQRVLDVETPELFGGNVQDEMNLHNIATEFTEYAYYLGAFVFLVLFPFIRFLSTSISTNNILKIIMPRPFIGIIGSIACSYNFDMWNNIFIQISFFSSIAILSLFMTSSAARSDRQIILFTIFLLASNQTLFLIYGENFDRLWEITEYKELFIPFGFIIYSIDLFLNSKRILLPDKVVFRF